MRNIGVFVNSSLLENFLSRGASSEWNLFAVNDLAEESFLFHDLRPIALIIEQSDKWDDLRPLVVQLKENLPEMKLILLKRNEEIKGTEMAEKVLELPISLDDLANLLQWLENSTL